MGWGIEIAELEPLGSVGVGVSPPNDMATDKTIVNPLTNHTKRDIALNFPPISKITNFPNTALPNAYRVPNGEKSGTASFAGFWRFLGEKCAL